MKKLLTCWMLTAAVMSVSGCNILGFPIAAFAPDKTVEALYTLPAEARAMVLVESDTGQLEYPQFRMSLARKLADRIYGMYLVEEIVDEGVVQAALAKLDRAYAASGSPAPLDALASETGADIVIYLEIRSFRLSEHSAFPMWTPTCDVAVKVVDAAGKQLWPLGFNSAHVVNVKLDTQGGEDPSLRQKFSDELAAETAVRVARLFHEYDVPRF